ncbi:MAG: hypothetical protein KKE44_20330 [Proteobacteria bacterium]|nr:hypothetical protein [Pseudomonadota bacterium]MBU1585080.1 hypothetical protein [Pseudomonadota bacterium]MBU2456007.1 hypothetical protein [Pseudomonadota bacterium]MBU2629323.1 hypothetical protein [Pseudomonadota bacterium]
MCEPYTVNRDDWLYKIFRKKGEISEKDFPHFLIIFKEINPQISNIDAIEPGIHILIPLKKVEKDDYDQSTPGNVDVPVIEFSAIPEHLDLAPFIKEHKIKRGENISNLIDKDFLNKGGAISAEGLKAFQLANPSIKNINIVYEGADIYLPDPSIKSQPWFQSFLSGNTRQPGAEKKEQEIQQFKVEAFKLIQLKKYSSLIGGTLLSHGKMYFPERNSAGQVLDLSSSPIIETSDGSKILIISGENVNDALLKSVQAYWKDLKTQLMSETIYKLENATENEPLKKSNITLEHKKIIEILLSQTEYDYIPDAKIPFMLNNIRLEASFGRVLRKDTTDLLINFGNVYGSALDVLEKREFEIILIPPQLTLLELAEKLFSHLGYSTWDNPSFFTGETVEIIDGLYATKEQDKLFVPVKPLSQNAKSYLEKEDIKILSTKTKTFAQ